MARHLEEINPPERVDNTKVVVGPSRVFRHKGAMDKYNHLSNNAIASRSELLYSIARFLPWTRYLTDVGDMTGRNPASVWDRRNGGNYSYDSTDGMGIGGMLFEGIMNNEARNLENQQGNKRVTVGRGKYKHSYIRTPTAAKESAKWYRAFGKYNPLKMAGILGDSYQGIKAVNNFINNEKALNNFDKKAFISMPYSYDTSQSKENNTKRNLTITNKLKQQ